MAISIPYATRVTVPLYLNPLKHPSLFQFNNTRTGKRSPTSIIRIKCEYSKELEVGSPVIVIEAPKMIKTAASVPCLRVNSGLIKPGDVGRLAFLLLFINYLKKKNN